jgi:hypothetical protein
MKNTLRDLLEGFPDFGLFSSTAKVSGFLGYQLPD